MLGTKLDWPEYLTELQSQLQAVDAAALSRWSDALLVAWENGRSRPKVYNHGRYRFSTYFGDMDRPLERNVFNGSHGQLNAFWNRHGMALR